MSQVTSTYFVTSTSTVNVCLGIGTFGTLLVISNISGVLITTR